MRTRGSGIRFSAAISIAAASVLSCGRSSDELITTGGKCAGVYESVYNACLERSNCVGLQCLEAMARCGADARREVAVCCADNFPDQADFQECVDSLGRSR